MPKTFLPRLNPEWFNDWHKSLISTMQNMYLINEPIGLASLNRYHKDKIVQLVSICNTYTTDREFEYQIKALEYDYKHKQLIERIASINKNDNLSQIVNYLQESISESQLTTNTKVDSISQVTANVLDEMESAIKRGDTKRGIDTGFQYLNRYIGGYNKGNLIIIGGRPGCFDGEQLIHTKRGLTKIKDITTNDYVLSYNHEKDINEWRKVLARPLHKSTLDKMFKITLKDGTVIKVTENHEFFTSGAYMKIKEYLLPLLHEKDLETN